MLHDVVPIALPARLLVVLVVTLVPLSALVLLLVVVLMLVLLLTLLLEVEAAPLPMTTKQSRKARVDGTFMMRLRVR